MELRTEDREIIYRANSTLHDSMRNMTCLSDFLKDEYPDRSTVSDLVLFMGLIRMQDLERILNTSLKYPVFGKECELLSVEEMKSLLTLYNIDRYGYLDYSDSPDGHCVNLC